MSSCKYNLKLALSTLSKVAISSFRIPEIGEELPDKAPLVKQDGLPEFTSLTIENCMAAVAKQTLDFEAGVKEIEENLVGNEKVDVFKDVFVPLEELGAPLDLTWGISKTLYLGNSSMMPTKSYLAIHDRAKRARASKFNSRPIYEAVKRELGIENKRNYEEVRLLKKFKLEGKLNGLELDRVKKAILDEHLKKLTIEKEAFKHKITVATGQFSHKIEDETIVRDFPVSLLKSIAADRDNYHKAPWKITLQPHIYKSVLEYCPVRNIRWNIWQAIVGRGSTYRFKELETSVHIEEIRSLRQDVAKTLGYKTYVDMSMETKMAGTLENVQTVMDALLERAKPAQDTEIKDLFEFAKKSGFEGSQIELWDVPYWRRKQRITLYDYKEDKFRELFPLPKVLEGLFGLCENLFDITIKQRSNVSTWHRDVQYYDVFEKHTSASIAGFYLDPFARSEEKIPILQSAGWMVGIQNGSKILRNKPLAALIFHFRPPFSENPSFLDFKEVQALFQQFGHSLQHLLTKAAYSEVAGVSNVEWDAVEICGNVLSHWLYNKSTLKAISNHDPFSDELFDTLINVKNHCAGFDLCRELYLSALDLELHSSKEFWLPIIKNLWPKYRSFPLDKLDSHPCSFTQVFAEESAAAYYSHVWARLIAADVYSAFHEVQGDDVETAKVGKRFRDTFLALGGSCHPSEVFRKFRGRDPSPKALLKSLGLKKLKTVDENK